MPIQSRHLQQAFGDFSDLFAEAEKTNATIHEKAVPLLLGAVAYCAVPPVGGQSRGDVRNRALSAWVNMLEEKQGQVILQADIWEWIRKWLPDPVQGERAPITVADFMGKLGI
jgi:hypothetical protein